MHLYVRVPIVGSVSVDMMDNLATSKPASNLLLRLHAMFVGISTHVGQMMMNAYADQNITIGSDRTSSLPLSVFASYIVDCHI